MGDIVDGCIIAKAVNKQNTSKLLLYKLYFKMIFDFTITTSKMIMILNHLYLKLILKSSTYDDFAHLCTYDCSFIALFWTPFSMQTKADYLHFSVTLENIESFVY